MNETLKTINDRIFSNPIYFIFSLSWFLVHWRFFATMFLVSNDSVVSNYHVTKDVYLKHILFDPNHLVISSLIVTLPFLVTWLILYHIQPKLLLVLFKKHKGYEVEKERIEIITEKELAEAREKKVKAEVAEVKAKVNKVRAEKEIQEDKTVKWGKEYDEFKLTQHYGSFGRIVESIYQHNGLVMWYPRGGTVKIGLPQSLLAYAHTHELVELGKDGNNQTITLTEKGKFFVAKMTQEGSI